MKNLISRVFVLIVVGLCAIAVQAQTGATLYANVPFSFSIGDRHMDSGQYSIKLLANNVESWRDANGNPAALFITLHKEMMGDLGHPRLVFRRYGDQYVLREIWTPDSAHEALHSKYEQKLARVGSKDETVALLDAPAK